MLENLETHAAPACTTISASGHSRARDVETFVRVSARHLSTAMVARDLYARRVVDEEALLSALDTDGATLDLVVLNLAFGSGTTALDLCATALWYWVNPNTKVASSLGNLRSDRLDVAGLELDEQQDDWLRLTTGSHHYKPLAAYRNRFVHGVIRQDAVAGAGANGVSVGLDFDPEASTTPVGKLIFDTTSFVEARWRAFCDLFT